MVPACGSSGGSLTLDELAAEMAGAVCAKAYQCCNTTEIEDFQGTNFTDEASCQVFYAGGIETYLVTLMRNAVADGTGTYDAGNAKKCLDAYASLGCSGSNDPEDFFSNCTNPYTGLQTTDEACKNVMECVEKHSCPTDTKVCTAFLKLNDTCETGTYVYCEAGLYCDGSNCVALKAKDADCAANTECSTGKCDDSTYKCVDIDPVCTGN